MSSRRFTRFLFVVVIVATLLLGAARGWPIWVWFLLPTLGAGTLLIGMGMARPENEPAEQDTEPDDAAPKPLTEQPYRRTSVAMVPIESAVADCPFLFSATVWWQPVDGSTTSAHGNPAALAVTSVLQHVQDAASAEHPSRCAFLAHELEGRLGTPEADEAGLVTAFATDVRLVLRQKDREHLEELDGLRKAAGTWESRRQHELSLREYLGQDVLQSPGSAVVWWLARHDDQIERAVDMIAPLTVLSAAANDQEIPEAYRDLLRTFEREVVRETTDVPEYQESAAENELPNTGSGHVGVGQVPPVHHLADWMDEMGFAEGSAERAAFLHRLARMSAAAGRPEAAEYIRRNMSGADQDSGQRTAGSLDGNAERPMPSAEPAYSPPPFPDDKEQPWRGGGWQVSSDGQVSEADVPLWPDNEDTERGGFPTDSQEDER